MAAYKTHVTTLDSNAARYASLPALKVPSWSQDEHESEGWSTITFAQFLEHVEKYARYWADKLKDQGLKERSIVGMWLTGKSYLDVAHIWGISRAGFTPQLISFRMTSPAVVQELLERSEAEALILDPDFESLIGEKKLPTFPTVNIFSSDVNHLPLPALWEPSSAEDVVIIMHTSGSTAGSPKLVPYTAKWFNFIIEKMRCFPRESSERQDVMVIAGTFCHLGGFYCLVRANDRGACVVLPTEVPYSPSELQQMVNDCGVRGALMFSSYAGNFIREARSDSSMLETLQTLDYIVHGGLPLEASDELWAREQGVNLVNFFASTEVSGMLEGVGGQGEDAGLLRPYLGTSFEFIPVSEGSGLEQNGEGPKLVELIVPPTSPDCPHISLRDKKTGKFHTGDLFVEVKPGYYQPRGRNDDWIKMEISLRCDTHSIEDNAMDTCSKDLISAAVVVGSGRPSPVLYVEPKDSILVDSEDNVFALRQEIFRRIIPFHERRYMHERIGDARFVQVKPRGTLPRTGTKGNVQRKMVENKFQAELDGLFAY